MARQAARAAEQAAKAAMIYSYIEKLPDGFQTQLSDNGVHISKGQRQLLTIARAMLSDARMLILDEATSALDTISEKKIQDSVERLVKDRTTLIVAHRLSTIEKADRIYVIEGGKICEEGRHDELVARGGVYGRLAALSKRNA